MNLKIRGDVTVKKTLYDLRKEIRELKLDNNMLQKIECSAEEVEEYLELKKLNKKLPDGVFEYKDESGELVGFYRICEQDLSEQEKSEYLLLKQLETLKATKNGVVFIAALLAVLLILSFFHF